MSLLLGFGIAFAFLPLAHAVGRLLRIVDAPGDLKIHSGHVPVTGGAAVLPAALLAMAILDEVGPFLIAGVALAWLVGSVDDLRPLPPWVRIAALLGSGLMVAAGGGALEALGPAGEAGVVVLVVACANAVNIMDGQDGLAGGLAGLAVLGIAAAGSILAGAEAPGAALPLAGSLLAFLLWNRPPARLFLGNGGAYGVGVLLAAAAVELGRSWHGLAAAGICLSLLAFEVIYTIARRTLGRSRLTSGDRGHSYDLLARKVGRKASTISFWAVGASAAGLGALAATAPSLGMTLAAVVAGVALVAGWRLLTRGRAAGTAMEGAETGRAEPRSAP